MVLEAIPKTAGARPPTFGGPPIGTTFSNEPDGSDDHIVSLHDNVSRLVAQAERSSTSEWPLFMRLLDQRRTWIRRELDMEGLLSEDPKAPLGIPDNAYDLTALSIEPVDDRRKTYERMVELIDRTIGSLWDRMMFSPEAGEA